MGFNKKQGKHRSRNNTSNHVHIPAPTEKNPSLKTLKYLHVTAYLKLRDAKRNSAKGDDVSDEKRKEILRKTKHSVLLNPQFYSALKKSSRYKKEVRNTPFKERDDPKFDDDDIIDIILSEIVEERENGTESIDSSGWKVTMNERTFYYLDKNNVEADTETHRSLNVESTKAAGCYEYATSEKEGRQAFADFYLKQIRPIELGKFILNEIKHLTRAAWIERIAKVLNREELPDKLQVDIKTGLLAQGNKTQKALGHVVIAYNKEGIQYGEPNYYANFDVLLDGIRQLMNQTGRITGKTSRKRERDESDSESIDPQTTIRKLRAKVRKLELSNKNQSLRLKKFTASENTSRGSAKEVVMVVVLVVVVISMTR